MSRFQYNFTRESEFQELKERNKELEEQNYMLKKSLEELIKVNTQLTQSIEEFNNTDNSERNEELERKMQMILNQNHKLREELESKSDTEKQTESLVGVLQELIDSFKNVQGKHENQINEIQRQLEQAKNSFDASVKKLQNQVTTKSNTIEALSNQLKRKDDLLSSLQQKLYDLQSNAAYTSRKSSTKRSNQEDPSHKLEAISKLVDQKNKVIQEYQKLLITLKSKIMEKY